MANDIILNLTTNEYLDSFTNEELWQQAAKKKLVEMLKKTSDEAKAYERNRFDNKCKNTIYAAHNAICISGERGAGKTVFLRNVENFWKKSLDNKEIDDIFFLEIIDPTLLCNHDEFANVIVAQLYNAVEKNYNHLVLINVNVMLFILLCKNLPMLWEKQKNLMITPE